MKATITIEGETFEKFPVLVQDDYGWSISFTLRYNDDTIVNLTNATVKFKTAPINGGALKIDGTCTVLAPTTGVATYALQITDLDTVGNYETEVEVTFAAPATPSIFTVKLGKLQVVADL